jgi:hypothetical protein
MVAASNGDWVRFADAEQAVADEREKIVRQMRLHAARLVEYYEDSGFTNEHVLNLLIQTVSVDAPDPVAPTGTDED